MDNREVFSDLCKCRETRPINCAFTLYILCKNKLNILQNKVDFMMMHFMWNRLYGIQLLSHLRWTYNPYLNHDSTVADIHLTWNTVRTWLFYAGTDVKASHLQRCNLHSENAVHKCTCNQSRMKVLIVHFSAYTKLDVVACFNVYLEIVQK
jgi:hypothetical protein